MITKRENLKMRRALGNNWIPEVITELNNKNVFNKRGNSFTKGFISHVFNGLNSHPKVEEAIINVYLTKLDVLSKMKEEKKNRLKKTA